MDLLVHSDYAILGSYIPWHGQYVYRLYVRIFLDEKVLEERKIFFSYSVELGF